ncbi:MAG TPA: glycerol-3-phosphate dehydrogenase/oxidase [Longimicrobiales bacterium]|nr:glycerol-3-phosphate dehydrogenase/oxidase [Longimicrobiales bacterium]
MLPISRDLAGLESGAFDVLVIGGGIVGACIARDAAMRGLRVALVEREDFGAGATANSLKIVHGGFRYLQRLDLARARASAREQAAWFAIARHLVEPLPVLVAARPGEFPPLPLLAGAAALYGLVSAGTRSRLNAYGNTPAETTPLTGPASRRRASAWPGARLLSSDECTAAVPELDAARPAGGLLFHDAILHSPERLVLEVIGSAVDAGAVVLNHVEVESPRRRAGRLIGAQLRDRMSGASASVEARRIVVAAGAWTPRVAALLAGRPVPSTHAYALAMNLVVPVPGQRVAFAVTSHSRSSNGVRRLFAVPWRGRTLIGTAQFAVPGTAPEPVATEAHIDAFLAELAAASPPVRLRRDDVVLVHAGLLPCDSGSDEPRLLTRHRIRTHTDEGVPELISVMSVKLTTARLLAEQVVDRLFRADGRTPPRCRTASTPLAGGVCDPSTVRNAVRATLPNVDDDIVDHLARTYGARFREVLRHRSQGLPWMQRVVPDAPVIRAQLDYAASAEGAVTVDDILHRRTELGPCGLITQDSIAMAQEALAATAARSLRPGAARSGHAVPTATATGTFR